nr:hypothetical protein [Tanacetum cinerariifolium]
MAPRVVLMKTGLRPLNTARLVNTGHPKTIVHCARPMSRFSKSAQSTVKRPYQQRTTFTNKSFRQTVNTARPRPINTARPRPVNTLRPRPVNTARPNSVVVNAVRTNKSHTQQVQEDQGYVDSGCSRHMTGNMSYLSDFKEFNGGYVTFGGGANGGRIIGKGTIHTGNLDFKDVYFVKELKFNLFIISDILLRVPRMNNMYSVDMKNIISKESLTCLVAKATLDESMLWHRRLDHINYKNINKLVKDNLVRGLSSKRFENDQTCVACLKGKQHKASSTKDETSGILKKFITEIENLVDKKVKVIRSDNRTEFKNSVLNKFCAMKGIKRKFSVARTPQQNGVAERRNRILIEAARYMVYNIRTVRLEDNLHIEFLENKPIVAGAEPKWLFDIDMLTESMNYVSVIADYILMPLWKNGLLFYSSSKNPTIDEPQSSCDAKNKDDNGVNKDSGINAHEKSTNSINDLNTIGPSINIASTDFDTGSLNINIVSPTVYTASLEATHADFFDDQPEGDMSNINTTYQVPSTPNTRIHKDHSLDLVIGDVQNKKDERGTVIKNKARLVVQDGCEECFPLWKVKEEVYVCQSSGFEDPDHPEKVYKVVKAIYGLHQALREWIASKQKEDGIFISQDKYVTKVLRKFNLSDAKTANTPVDIEKPLVKDADGDDVDVHLYRSMIGSLMYLITSRPEIMYTLCVYARFQVTPKCKKQTMVATSTTEAEYVAATSCCRQAMLVQGPILQGKASTIPVESHHTPSDEAAFTGVDIRHGGATTTVSSLDAEQGNGTIDKTPSMSHDSPLPRVNTLVSDEGSMTLNELMVLCTKLSQKVDSLEKTIKSSQVRRRAKIVVFDDEELKDPSKQGRNVAKVHTYAKRRKEISTASGGISTAEELVSTAGASMPVSTAGMVDKGKAIMQEFKHEQTTIKLQQRQERAGYEAAVRLQEQLDEDERQRIARVHEEARSHTLQQLKRLFFDELKNLFEATMKRVQTFTPIESDVDRKIPKIADESSKGAAEEEELEQESSKRQKTGESSESREKEDDELT